MQMQYIPHMRKSRHPSNDGWLPCSKATEMSNNTCRHLGKTNYCLWACAADMRVTQQDGSPSPLTSLRVSQVLATTVFWGATDLKVIFFKAGRADTQLFWTLSHLRVKSCLEKVLKTNLKYLSTLTSRNLLCSHEKHFSWGHKRSLLAGYAENK